MFEGWNDQRYATQQTFYLLFYGLELVIEIIVYNIPTANLPTFQFF